MRRLLHERARRLLHERARRLGDGDGRVRALLDEGEAAFGHGDYQSAIDAWSRIFLIDIDNEEAAKRIERARQLKAEQERAVEEVFHDGVARFDAGAWEAAREAFRRVLAEQSSYVLAREYLDKLEERAASGAAPSGLPEMAPLPSLGAPARREEGEPAVRRRAGGEEILVPPEPGDRRETRQPVIEGFAAKKKKGIRLTPAFLAIGGTVLVALGVGGWFLTSNSYALGNERKCLRGLISPRDCTGRECTGSEFV